jgi:hypothetical protein
LQIRVEQGCILAMSRDARVETLFSEHSQGRAKCVNGGNRRGVVVSEEIVLVQEERGVMTRGSIGGLELFLINCQKPNIFNQKPLCARFSYKNSSLIMEWRA